MNAEHEFKYAKRDSRELSEFFGEELIYDFLVQDLDPVRTRAMDSLLETSEGLRLEMKKIQTGMQLINEGKQFSIEPDLLKKISLPKGYFLTLWGKLQIDQWPEGVRLSIEGLLVALTIVVVALLIPWNRFLDIHFYKPESVILAEVFRKAPVYEDSTSDMDEKLEKKNPENLFPDETAVAAKHTGEKVETPAQSVAASELVGKNTPPSAIAKPAAKIEVADNKTKSLPAPPAPAVKPETHADPVKAVATATHESVAEPKKATGFLYRGVMETTNIEAVTPKLVDKVGELGGRKAGEVPLGWKRAGGSYFHFTIPESKYQAFLDYFQTFGTLKIDKEKHDRVMPDGILRVIIQVNESAVKKEAKPLADTPPKTIEPVDTEQVPSPSTPIEESADE